MFLHSQYLPTMCKPWQSGKLPIVLSTFLSCFKTHFLPIELHPWGRSIKIQTLLTFDISSSIVFLHLSLAALDNAFWIVSGSSGDWISSSSTRRTNTLVYISKRRRGARIHSLVCSCPSWGIWLFLLNSIKMKFLVIMFNLWNSLNWRSVSTKFINFKKI